ncbi:MAG TPA: sulfotransferase [Thermoanaerobaculia bacterium]
MNSVVGLLTENAPRMLTQATRLLRSLRWFGGALSNARVVVCGVGELEANARATLESLGAEVRTVSRFHARNPTANRHQLIASLLDEPEDVYILLDCDTLIVQDPSRYLRDDVFQAKIAPGATVTDAVFERLFAHFGIPKPPRSRTTALTGEATIPYYNGGVLVLPKPIIRTLAPVWRRFNQELADHPELVSNSVRHMHQASLALALAQTGVPCADLPEEMNHQINATHFAAPRWFVDTDPVILHYHHLATDDGFLMPCPYPATQRRIEQFHARMRAEGFVPQTEAVEALPAAEERPSRPIVVLGMHRSGTSLTTQLVAALGAYVGGPDDLPPPDMFNPTGFWEHKEVVRLGDEILAALGSSWMVTHEADVARLPHETRAAFVQRARDIVARSLQGHGPFVVKDPRMSLLFPIWREAFGEPVCVLAWRDPMAVARSLETRDGLPLIVSLAAWEQSTRTLLRDSEGLSRVLVSYEQLLADPQHVTRELHAALTSFGVEGLTLLSAEQLRQFVNTDFDRSGRTREDSLLDESQRQLVADLTSGAALTKPAAPVPQRTLQLLAGYATLLTKNATLTAQNHALLARNATLIAKNAALREQLSTRDNLLDAVFTSRTWRLARRLIAAITRRRGVTAEDRWRAMRDRRQDQ